MSKPIITSLAPMLAALGIQQTVSLDESLALFTELRAKTGATPPPLEISGSHYCALINLALARYQTKVTA